MIRRAGALVSAPDDRPEAMDEDVETMSVMT
jgi:hypothetical protein